MREYKTQMEAAKKGIKPAFQSILSVNLYPAYTPQSM